MDMTKTKLCILQIYLDVKSPHAYLILGPAKQLEADYQDSANASLPAPFFPSFFAFFLFVLVLSSPCFLFFLLLASPLH